MRSSMGRTGACWDCHGESFFSALKNERVYRTAYATKAQARRDVIAYIEGFYNNQHHSSIGHVTPVDFEMQYSSQAAEIQLAA